MANVKKINKTISKFFIKNTYPQKFNLNLLRKMDTVVHYLTWRCNSRCITCSCWQTSPEEKEKEVWTPENIKKFYSSIKVDFVYLTGGEPTVVPNFKEIVYLIYKTSKADISFNTNSLAIQKIKEDFLWLKSKEIPFSVSLSCNGFEKTHDFSRVIKGNYQKVLELINFLEENKIKYNLLYTIFPFNIDETSEFVDFWRRKKGVWVGLMLGRSDERYKLKEISKRNLNFSKEDYKKIEKILSSLIKTYPDYLPIYYLVKGINENKKTFPCFGLVKRIEIDPYGNVYPCDGLLENLFMGNLKESDFNFNVFLEKNKNRIEKVFEIIKEKKCQPCSYVCDLVYGIELSLPKKDLAKIYFYKLFQKCLPK